MKRRILHDADSYLDYVKKVLKPLPIRPDNDLKPMFLMFFDDEANDEEFNNVYNLDRPHPDDGGVHEVMKQQTQTIAEKIATQLESLKKDVVGLLEPEDVETIAKEKGLVVQPPTFVQSSEVKNLLTRQKEIRRIPVGLLTKDQKNERNKINEELLNTAEKQLLTDVYSKPAEEVEEEVDKRAKEKEKEMIKETEDIHSGILKDYKARQDQKMKELETSYPDANADDITKTLRKNKIKSKSFDKNEIFNALKQRNMGDREAVQNHIKEKHEEIDASLEKIEKDIKSSHEAAQTPSIDLKDSVSIMAKWPNGIDFNTISGTTSNPSFINIPQLKVIYETLATKVGDKTKPPTKKQDLVNAINNLMKTIKAPPPSPKTPQSPTPAKTS
jgi:cytochrome c556